MAHVVVLTAALAVLLPIAALAEEAPLPSHRCAAIDKASARLACFDASFVAPDGTANIPRDNAADEFGLQEADLRARNPGRVVDPELEQLEATVKLIDDSGTGKSVITMDNGQVWTAERHSTAGRLAVGDSVVIRKGALSSHMLVTPKGRAFRVRRAR